MIKQGNRRLWHEYWHLLAHRSELSTPKDFVRLDIDGEEVAIFNDGTDIVAFDNHCPHRGARIFDGNCGREAFRCQYHGWSFSNGKLFVSQRELFPDCDRSDFVLAKLRTCWVGDFLFVSHAPKQTIESQLGEFLPIVERISTSILRREDFNSYRYECEWQIAIENALEPYHVGVIHPDSLNALKLQAGEDAFAHCNSAWRTTVGDVRLAKRLKRVSDMLNVDFRHEGYINILLFPFTMISSTFGLSYSIQNFFPAIEPDQSHFASRLFSARARPGLNPDLMSGFYESTKDLNRKVFAEDNAICARIPSRSWSDARPRYLASNEQRIAHFRQQFKLAVGS